MRQKTKQKTRWTEHLPGVWVNDSGTHLLVDCCDCREEGCPGEAHMEDARRVAEELEVQVEGWDLVRWGGAHTQVVSW